jgi:hypothetical protein
MLEGNVTNADRAEKSLNSHCLKERKMCLKIIHLHCPIYIVSGFVKDVAVGNFLLSLQMTDLSAGSSPLETKNTEKKLPCCYNAHFPVL